MLKKIECVEKIIKESNIMAEISDYGIDYISVDIQWGDWKHDHLRLDFLIKEELNPKEVKIVVLEEDGTDCYSARHNYKF